MLIIKNLLALPLDISSKGISTSCVRLKKVLKSGKEPYDKRFGLHILDAGPDQPGGSKELQERLSKGLDMPRRPGIYKDNGEFEFIPEMVPEFVVPELKEFKLKPYVSYTVKEITQNELTPKELFDSIYAKEIAEDLFSNKIDAETAKKKLVELKSNIDITNF